MVCKRKMFQEEGRIEPGQAKTVNVHPKGVCVLQPRGFLEIIVYPAIIYSEGGWGMEISQEPAFEHLTVGERMVPCRQG